MFSFRYESEFFQNVVNRHDIISWGAVDRSRPSAQRDELIGFVTIKTVLARESEVYPLAYAVVVTRRSYFPKVDEPVKWWVYDYMLLLIDKFCVRYKLFFFVDLTSFLTSYRH